MNDKILFYENEYYIFSNFSSFAVEKDGVVWQTSEHLYQASKFMGESPSLEIIEEIRNARSAHDSKKITKKYPDSYRPDWEEVKIQVMENIIRLKHDQHEYIQKKLKESGDREIIENSPKDAFWGWGPDKDGRNELGKIWMRLRNELYS